MGDNFFDIKNNVLKMSNSSDYRGNGFFFIQEKLGVCASHVEISF